MTADLSATIQKTREHSIGDLLRRSARRNPDKTALICGAVTWTFAEMDAICNRLARGLLGIAIKKGDRVAVLSRNSHAFAALRFAVARIGAVLVPINFMLKPDEINFILANSGAKLLAVGPDFVDAARAATAKGSSCRKANLAARRGSGGGAGGPSNVRRLLDADASQPDASVDSRDAAQIIYTSGTESLPKGAMLTHEAVMWQYVSCIIDGGMAADDNVLHALPLYHCAQLDVFLGPAIYLGATSLITGKPTADNVLALIAAHKINVFFAPPTIWIAMLRSPAFDKTDLCDAAKGLLRSLDHAGGGSARIAAPLAGREVLEFLRPDGDRAACHRADTRRSVAQGGFGRQAGDQRRDARGRCRDARTSTSVRSARSCIARRICCPAITTIRSRPRRPSRAAGSTSGDLATVDADGYITVVDRVKDMIKTGGENVASREVEEMVYRLPAVSEVAVVGLPGSALDRGGHRHHRRQGWREARRR